MNEQRRDAYLKLINALLTCPSGEEGKILQDNAELVDAGLLETMVLPTEIASGAREQRISKRRSHPITPP